MGVRGKGTPCPYLRGFGPAMLHQRTLTRTLILLVGVLPFPIAVKSTAVSDSSQDTVQSHQAPSHYPRSVFESAQRALLAGDYKSAESGFREVLRLDSQSAAAYVNLGVVYMRTQKFDAAIKALESAKKLAPSMAGVDLNLGLAYYHKKNYPQAIPHFASVLA